jgi:hypothetical protein
LKEVGRRREDEEDYQTQNKLRQNILLFLV